MQIFGEYRLISESHDRYKLKADLSTGELFASRVGLSQIGAACAS